MQYHDFHQPPVRQRFRPRNGGFTLLELMVVVGIICVIVAVGWSRPDACRSNLKDATITLVNDILAARQAAQARTAPVNFYFGDTATVAAGVGASFANSWYVRHLDLNGNLTWNGGEDKFTKHWSCSGDAESVIELGKPTGAPDLTDSTGTHTEGPNGVSLAITTPVARAATLSFLPSGISNTLTPTSDTIYLRVRTHHDGKDQMSSGGVANIGRALVIRLNGKTLVYGYDPTLYKTPTWVLLR